MIQITPQMRILVAVDAQDFRKGIDGLARICREVLEADPFCGALFVFRNRRGTAIKIVVYDSQGFWLAQKRLSRGRFRSKPSSIRPAPVARPTALRIGSSSVARRAAAPTRRPNSRPARSKRCSAIR